MTQEFIAFDWCGWDEQHGRFTHVPTGETIVCRSGYDQSKWDAVQLAYFEKFDPTVPVHECPSRYTTEGTRPMGLTGEICERLRERLGLADQLAQGEAK